MLLSIYYFKVFESSTGIFTKSFPIHPGPRLDHILPSAATEVFEKTIDLAEMESYETQKVKWNQISTTNSKWDANHLP